MKKLLLVAAVLVLLVVLVAAVLFFALWSLEASTPVVLVWTVDGAVVEEPDPGFSLLAPDALVTSLPDLRRGLAAAVRDERVEGVVLYLRSTGFGMAKAEELHRLLTRVSEADKLVACYFESVGEGTNATLAYFLATACDQIHLAPSGEVNLLGVYSPGLFVRGSLDKLRVEPEFLAVGRYKSAGETFTRSDHSPAAEAALEAVLDGQWRRIVEAVAEGRNLDRDRVEEIVDRAPYRAETALELGLVDRLAYPDEFKDWLDGELGGEARTVPLETYGERPGGRGAIAVVLATGTIVRGAGGTDWAGELILGSDDLITELRRVADDPGIDAVVLRIDSPGGSALASDLILREVELLAETKPVVVSMSDVAASGGYYIAARTRPIIAEASTITGSIGVVAGRFATAGLETEILGITRDPIQRGANADLYGSPQPLGAERLGHLARLSEEVYDTFVGHVAEGRAMTREEVRRVAQGRVWLGADAAARGLVDELGGLDLALRRAREAAGLAPDADTRVVYYPEPRGLLETLLGDPGPDLPPQLAELADALAPALRARRGLLELSEAERRLAAPF